MKYYLIAGEASGDLHGSNLLKGLFAEDPKADVRFWGGALMEAVGGKKVRDYKQTAVMGIWDIVLNAGKIARNLRDCKADILSWKPDAVILIDYPGFNMKIARFCRSQGIKVFYYIAPKTWASREGRNRRLKEWVDMLFIVFPFEIPYFESKGIPFIYKGNPLLDAVLEHKYLRPSEKRYFAILPGSRKGEIAHTMPNAVKMADKLHSLPEYADAEFLIAGAPSRSEADYAPYIGERKYLRLLFGRTYDILKFADAALVNSGTASLEAALTGCPQVVCWSTQLLTALIGKYVLRVLNHIKYISLGNLILDKPAFKELIQYDYTPEAATAEIRRLCEDDAYREAMLADYARIRRMLGEGGASRAVAREMISILSGAEN